jgi:hypothetical protein
LISKLNAMPKHNTLIRAMQEYGRLIIPFSDSSSSGERMKGWLFQAPVPWRDCAPRS